MTGGRILIAGVGNIFLGDDGFGVEVAQRLMARKLPDSVQVIDFGIRGFDLAYALMDDHEATILVDATPRGGAPGTLYKIEGDLNELERLTEQQMSVETHGMNPTRVFGMVKAMGGAPKRLFIVGCEPATLEADEEGRIGLSEAVSASVNEAITMIDSLIEEILYPQSHRATHTSN